MLFSLYAIWVSHKTLLCFQCSLLDYVVVWGLAYLIMVFIIIYIYREREKGQDSYLMGCIV